MFKQLFSKWLGLDLRCETCEVLREQLHRSEAERREILTRLLDKDRPEPLITEKEEHVTIQPQFIPWRVRQQMLEAEDRKQVQLLKEKEKEIEISKLEKELGVS